MMNTMEGDGGVRWCSVEEEDVADEGGEDVADEGGEDVADEGGRRS